MTTTVAHKSVFERVFCILQFSAISATLKSKNYTKLAVPTLKQTKRFLKKEISLSNDEISSMSEENVIEKWGDMCEYND